MVPNRLALVLVAASCVSAAGAGSYIATRQSLAAAAAPAAVATPPASVSEPSTPTPSVPAALTARNASAPAATPAAPVRPRNADRTASRTASTERPARRVVPVVEPNAEPVERPASHGPVEYAAIAPEPAVVEPPVVADAAPAAPLPETREPGPAPAPVATKTLEDLHVAADAVIGLQSETSVNSERAKVEDRVEARVVRDVMVDGMVAIPAGTRVVGSVTVVDRGGKFRERARLGIRFNTLVFGDGVRVPISTDTIYRYGDAPSDKTAAKIGGATAAGAILGAIIGGSKGAAIGATTGAGAGTAAVMAGKAGAATFPSGVEVTARLTSPVTITVERE